MMKKVEDMSRPAATSDLKKYHQWLDARILQSDRIRHLVGSDLRAFASSPLSSSHQSSPQSSPASMLSSSLTSSSSSSMVATKSDEVQIPRTFQPQYLAYSAFINAVVPLTLFKLVTGVLNRLILLAIVVVIGSIVQDRMRIKIGKDELTCTLLSISISAFAAIFL